MFPRSFLYVHHNNNRLLRQQARRQSPLHSETSFQIKPFSALYVCPSMTSLSRCHQDSRSLPCCDVLIIPNQSTILTLLQEVESGTNTADDGSTNTYEEGWLPLPLLLDQEQPFIAVPEGPSGAIRLCSSPNPSPADRHCIVLKPSPSYTSPQPIGTIIRIGDWCQGILRQSRDGDDFAVARWARVDGKWAKLVEIGCEKSSMGELVEWLGRFDGAGSDKSGTAEEKENEIKDVMWIGVNWVVEESSTW